MTRNRLIEILMCVLFLLVGGSIGYGIGSTINAIMALVFMIIGALMGVIFVLDLDVEKGEEKSK